MTDPSLALVDQERGVQPLQPLSRKGFCAEPCGLNDCKTGRNQRSEHRCFLPSYHPGRHMYVVLCGRENGPIFGVVA